MKPSNKEFLFFFLCMGTVLIWSFLAGILLKLKDRYIGISITGISIAIIYSYVNDRLKKAKYINFSNLVRVNLNFYRESLNTALDKKQEWKIQGENNKTMLGNVSPDNQQEGGRTLL